jgi:hypothetical protein
VASGKADQQIYGLICRMMERKGRWMASNHGATQVSTAVTVVNAAATRREATRGLRRRAASPAASAPAPAPTSAPVSSPLRRFWLERKEDVSGNSGTGYVAQGVVAPDGRAVLIWNQSVLDPTRGGAINQYDSLEELEAVHSHGGRTTVVFMD